MSGHLRRYAGRLSTMPFTVAVNAVVGTVDPGIAVVLLSIEVWPTRTVLHLAARQDKTTDALDVEYQAAFEAWHASGRRERPTGLLASMLYVEMPLNLGDEAGTEFKLVQAHVGGQPTRWSSSRVYEPAPIGTLTVNPEGASGRESVRIPLMS
jgi:hypothetical protein